MLKKILTFLIFIVMMIVGLISMLFINEPKIDFKNGTIDFSDEGTVNFEKPYSFLPSKAENK